jgi:hypothetical protein
VRLKYGYIIKCEEVIKDDTGAVVRYVARPISRAKRAARPPAARSRERSTG